MKPIKFNEKNGTLTAPRDFSGCDSLPVCRTGLDVVSCWKMSFRERLAALFFGKVWVTIRAGKTHPPIFLSCEKTFFEKDKS